MLCSTLGILASLMIFGSTLQFDNFSTLNTRPPDNWPFVMNTWPFTEATDAVWHVLQHKTGEKMVAVGGGGEVLSNVMQQ